jgi:hypothetical protein
MLYLKRTERRAKAGVQQYRTQVVDTESTPSNSPVAGGLASTQERADNLALRAAQAQGIDPADIRNTED